VLDGSDRVDTIIRSAVDWDVMGGVARRAWARNEAAMETAALWNASQEAAADMGAAFFDEPAAAQAPAAAGHITLPHLVDDELLDSVLRQG